MSGGEPVTFATQTPVALGRVSLNETVPISCSPTSTVVSQFDRGQTGWRSYFGSLGHLVPTWPRTGIGNHNGVNASVDGGKPPLQEFVQPRSTISDPSGGIPLMSCGIPASSTALGARPGTTRQLPVRKVVNPTPTKHGRQAVVLVVSDVVLAPAVQVGHFNHAHFADPSDPDNPVQHAVSVSTPLYSLATPEYVSADVPAIPTKTPAGPVGFVGPNGQPVVSAYPAYYAMPTGIPVHMPAAPVITLTYPANVPAANPSLLIRSANPTSQPVSANSAGGGAPILPPVTISSPPMGVESGGLTHVASSQTDSATVNSVSLSANTSTISTARTQPVTNGKKRSPIKPDKFDWSMTIPLETFIAKFENCPSYNEWSESDRLYHLKANLEGQASEILWSIPAKTTEKEILELLRNRYGNKNQAERFRAELNARRRRPGESIQDVYNSICRLLAQAFPGQCGELVEFLGRAAFLKALDGPPLMMRVMDQQPKTLDDTLATVCLMASCTPLSASSTTLSDKRECNAVIPAQSDTNYSDHNQLQELKKELADQRQQIRQLQKEKDRLLAQMNAGGAVSPPVQQAVSPPSVQNQSDDRSRWRNGPHADATQSPGQRQQSTSSQQQFSRGRGRG